MRYKQTFTASIPIYNSAHCVVEVCVGRGIVSFVANPAAILRLTGHMTRV